MFHRSLTLIAVDRSKEHPNARRKIVREGLRPHPSAEAWNGTAVDAEGAPVEMSAITRTQMARMITEGRW